MSLLGSSLFGCRSVPFQPEAEPLQKQLGVTAGEVPTSTAEGKPLARPPATPAPGVSGTSPIPLTPTVKLAQAEMADPCWREGGQVVPGSLVTTLLPKALDYRIYLPPCYNQRPDQRYPVLYLIHGQSYTDDQWERLGAPKTADRLSAAGELPPFIIVMPRDRVWTQPAEDNFGQVLTDELVPYIEQHYRTIPERRFRAVGGLSRGAAWAVHLGLTQWQMFGAVGAHSLPVFLEDAPKVRTWLDAIPPEMLPRIYMDTGEKDYLVEATLWFEAILTEKNIPHEWHLFTGYHDEEYWSSHVEQYLRWYAEEWGE